MKQESTSTPQPPKRNFIDQIADVLLLKSKSQYR